MFSRKAQTGLTAKQENAKLNRKNEEDTLRDQFIQQAFDKMVYINVGGGVAPVMNSDK